MPEESEKRGYLAWGAVALVWLVILAALAWWFVQGLVRWLR